MYLDTGWLVVNITIFNYIKDSYKKGGELLFLTDIEGRTRRNQQRLWV